jgi:hypothetical protein
MWTCSGMMTHAQTSNGSAYTTFNATGPDYRHRASPWRDVAIPDRPGPGSPRAEPTRRPDECPVRLVQGASARSMESAAVHA